AETGPGRAASERRMPRPRRSAGTSLLTPMASTSQPCPHLPGEWSGIPDTVTLRGLLRWRCARWYGPMQATTSAVVAVGAEPLTREQVLAVARGHARVELTALA